MDIEKIRELALSLPYTTERQPYGPDCLVFEIGGKHFCLIDLTGQWGFYNIKVDPDYSLDLRGRYTSVRPGFHMNKRHWVSVDFCGDVSEQLHKELIVHAYKQTMKGLPKRVQAELASDI